MKLTSVMKMKIKFNLEEIKSCNGVCKKDGFLRNCHLKRKLDLVKPCINDDDLKLKLNRNTKHKKSEPILCLSAHVTLDLIKPKVISQVQLSENFVQDSIQQSLLHKKIV